MLRVNAEADCRPSPFEEHYACGYAHVQGRNSARRTCRHGNRNQSIAVARHGLVQPPSLASQDDRGWRVEFDTIVGLVAALVETINPIAALFQFFERAADVGHTHDRKIGQRAGRRAGDGFGQPCRTPFRNHDGGGAGCVRRAHDRTQVVRIFDAVQDDVQPAGRRSLFERRVTLRRAERHHPLMRGAARRAVQLRARLEAHRDPALAAQLDQFLKTRSRGSLRH